MSHAADEARLALLNKQNAVIVSEIREIEARLYAAEHASLVGKCFKFRNSGSCPREEADYWWLYSLITGIEGRFLSAFSFQRDARGQFWTRAGDPFVPGGGHIEIPRTEFVAAWEAMRAEMGNLIGAALNGARESQT